MLACLNYILQHLTAEFIVIVLVIVLGFCAQRTRVFHLENAIDNTLEWSGGGRMWTRWTGGETEEQRLKEQMRDGECCDVWSRQREVMHRVKELRSSAEAHRPPACHR